MTAGTNGHKNIFLNDAHRRELRDESAICHDVLSARGFRTIEKPTSANHRNMDVLLKHYPERALGKNGNYPGLYIPVFAPTGEQVHGSSSPSQAAPAATGASTQAQPVRPSGWTCTRSIPARRAWRGAARTAGVERGDQARRRVDHEGGWSW